MCVIIDVINSVLLLLWSLICCWWIAADDDDDDFGYDDDDDYVDDDDEDDDDFLYKTYINTQTTYKQYIFSKDPLVPMFSQYRDIFQHQHALPSSVLDLLQSICYAS